MRGGAAEAVGGVGGRQRHSLDLQPPNDMHRSRSAEIPGIHVRPAPTLLPLSAPTSSHTSRWPSPTHNPDPNRLQVPGPHILQSHFTNYLRVETPSPPLNENIRINGEEEEEEEEDFHHAWANENCLVRVRAQVMMRDDSTGGWLPMGSGGLSLVSVMKRNIIEKHSQETKHEYLIYGKRISDQEVILSCVIKKDFEYNKVMPTFHHWKTDNKKFGLTFQAAADARAFDKGVRTAIEELLDGIAAQYNTFMHHQHIEDVGDDDVFMTLNLPVERGDSHSSSDSSNGKTPPIRKALPPPAPGKAPSLTLPLSKTINPTVGKMGKALPPLPGCSEEQSSAGYPYIQLTTFHEYLYPLMEEGKGTAGPRRDSAGSLKKRSPATSDCKPAVSPSGRRKERCRHCQEPFSAESNVRGSCEYAPDCVKTGINKVACISCAECIVYHCMSDSEGDYIQHPCVCAPVEEGCGKRWIGLGLLSLVVPCLWCYPPLKACHWLGVTCGVCGGKHSPDN